MACSAENEIIDVVPIEDEEPNWFEMFWDTYPPRAGDRKRRESETKFKTRLKDGADPREIIAGAERYRRFIEATGRLKTEYVQQATTWLNNRAWLEEFEIPADVPKLNGKPKRETQQEIFNRLERDRQARIQGVAS